MLYERLLNPELLNKSLESILQKGSAGGIDHRSAVEVNDNKETELKNILKQLQDGSYTPEPYLQISIPKDENERRRLGLLSVRDKIVQHAILQIIEPLIEPRFIDETFAYRHHKGAVQAIHAVKHIMYHRKASWFVRCDIDNFFENIPHQPLFGLLEDLLHDEQLVNLILLCLQMGSIDDHLRWKESSKGIPQGAVLSPIIANFYLNHFDHLIHDQYCGYIRYADDIMLLSYSETEANRLFKIAVAYLASLKLAFNSNSVIAPVSGGVEFLGINIFPDRLTLTQKKIYALKEKIKSSLRFEYGVIVKKYTETIQGISRYYGQLIPQQELENLDEFQYAQLRLVLEQYTFKSIASKKKALEPILFLSSAYRNKRTELLAELTGRKISKSSPPVGEVTINPESLIAVKKKEFEKRYTQSMELIISLPGVFIGKSKFDITVKLKGELVMKVPLVNLTHLSVVSDGTSMSSHLIFYCAEKNIPIDFFDPHGHPLAKIYPSHTTDAELWIAQLKANENGKAAEIMSRLVQYKIRNQVNLVHYYHKYHGRNAAYDQLFKETILKMELLEGEAGAISDSDLNIRRGKLLSSEGRAAAMYWDFVKTLLPSQTGFEGRERKGATDLVNMMLNYGYGILYSRIWNALMSARLNAYISYLHSYQHGEPTLSFDLIEVFRQQVVDRPVIAMLNRGEKTPIENGLLTMETRKLLAEHIMERLNRKENYRGEERTLSEIMRLQALHLGDYISGKEQTYKPYVAKW